MTSKHVCPDCKQPLSMEVYADEVFLFCAYGPCASQVANDGASGETEAQAFKKLEQAVEDDINDRL